MTIANFEQFCRTICEVAGIPASDPVADAYGSQCFVVRMHDVTVTALQTEKRPHHAYLMAELGAMPEDEAEEGWRGLLDANLHSQHRDAPVFSRDPASGQIVLQCALSLFHMTQVDVHQRLNTLVETALDWRASDDFSRPLKSATGRVLAQAAVRGVEAKLIETSNANSRRGIMTMKLGTPTPDQERFALPNLMEANFCWMTMQPALVLGRDAKTGEVLLQLDYPLNGAHEHSEDLQAITEDVAALSADWRQFDYAVVE